jgi:hypothetical protein
MTTLLAIFTLGFVFGGCVLSMVITTILRQKQHYAMALQTLPTNHTRDVLAFLPDNNHIVNWLTTPLPRSYGRAINFDLIERIPGPVLHPLKPSETLLYADDLGQLYTSKTEQLPYLPLQPETLAS